MVHFGGATSMFTNLANALNTLVRVSVGEIPDSSDPLLYILMGGFFVFGVHGLIPKLRLATVSPADPTRPAASDLYLRGAPLRLSFSYAAARV